MGMKQYIVYGAGPCPLVENTPLLFPSKEFTSTYNDHVNELWELAQEFDQGMFWPRERQEREAWELGPWVIGLDSLRENLQCSLEHEAIGGWINARFDLTQRVNA